MLWHYPQPTTLGTHLGKLTLHRHTSRESSRMYLCMHKYSSCKHTQRKCTHTAVSHEHTPIPEHTYVTYRYTYTSRHISRHTSVHKNRHRTDCLSGPESSSLHVSTSSEMRLCSSSPGGRVIFLPIESGFGCGLALANGMLADATQVEP